MTRTYGRFSRLIPCLICLGIWFSATEAGAQAVVLDDSARKAIATFGDGVIEPAKESIVPRGGVQNVLQYAGLTPGTSVWKIVEGYKSGRTLNRTVQPHPLKKLHHIVITEGFHTSVFELDNGSIFRTSQVSVEHATLSTFKPFEPVLLENVGMGRKVKTSIALAVHAVGNPKVVTHSGTLEAVYEVLGTFVVRTPAGTYNAIGVRVSYSGSVGPASINDESYVFFSREAGPVAIRGTTHISAFLIYNESRQQSMLLESLPEKTDVVNPVGPTD